MLLVIYIYKFDVFFKKTSLIQSFSFFLFFKGDEIVYYNAKDDVSKHGIFFFCIFINRPIRETATVASDIRPLLSVLQHYIELSLQVPSKDTEIS